MASILKSLTSICRQLTSPLLSPSQTVSTVTDKQIGSVFSSILCRGFLSSTQSATPSASGPSLLQGFLQPGSPSSHQPVRHGTAGHTGCREWAITRHWSVPVPSFYGPVRYNLLNGESVGVRKVFWSFKRLNNGLWIRARAGRKHRLYLRGPVHRASMRKHIMCTGGQNKKLDLMVRAHMRRPKYYVDDPYEPYQRRHGLDDVYYQPPRPFLP